jgi:dTDP-4-dehydrorhamnose reductase
MNDPALTLAEGKGIVLLLSALADEWRPAVVIAQAGTARARVAVDADQLRWLIHTGGPAALAALDQPAPTTEGGAP